MAGPRIIILTAIQREARAVARVAAGRAEVHAVGIGAIHVPDLSGASLVVLTGLAGGLDPAVRVGDVIVDEESTAEFPGEGLARRRCVCSRQIVGSVKAKAELFRQIGAAYVEMESELVRAKCAAVKVPFLHLRAISDAAGDAIDPAILRFVDPFGRPRLGAVISYLIRQPRMLNELHKLTRASSFALKNLEAPIERILQHFG